MSSPAAKQLPLLLAGAIALRAYAAWTSGLVADDAVQYVELAELIEAADWDGALASWTPPLQPLLLALLHRATGDWVLGGTILEIVAGAVIVLAVYALTHEAFGASAAVWAGTLAAVHPELAREVGLLLADATALALTALSLWLGVLGGRRRPLLATAASGMAAGLAYLARPEGVLAAAVLGPWLVAIHAFRPGRRHLALLAPAALLAGFLATGGPYALYLSLDEGRPVISRKKFADAFEALRWGPGYRWSRKVEERKKTLTAERAARVAEVRGLAEGLIGGRNFEWEGGKSSSFVGFVDPKRNKPADEPRPGILRALAAALGELPSACHPAVLALGLIGLLLPSPGDRPWRRAFVGLFLAGVALNVLVLLLVNREAGYVSHRHAMGAVLFVLPLSALGAGALTNEATGRFGDRFGSRRVVVAVALVVLATILPKTLKPRSERRLAERRVAERIADGSLGDPGVVVSCLPRIPLYAGRPGVQLPQGGGYGALVALLVSKDAALVVVDERHFWLIAPLVVWAWLQPVHEEGEGERRIRVFRTLAPLRDGPRP